MGQNPLVSVIIPVYNGEKTIRDTILSVLNQTYDNLEVLVIDDASSDNSKDIILSFDDDRIKPILLDKNVNLCVGSNLAYEKSRGKYIALLGHDDICEPDRIREELRFIEETPGTVACFSWINVINDDNNNINHLKKDWLNRIDIENRSRKDWMVTLIENGNLLSAPTALILKDAVKETGLYRNALLQTQDYDLWLRLLTKGTFNIVPQRLVNYRRFDDEKRHVGNDTIEVKNRMWHELNFIVYDNIRNMDNALFIECFGHKFKCPDSKTEYEILCEKACLLAELKNCYYTMELIRLYDIPKCKKYLEEKCGVSLADFYKMNSAPILFDHAYYDICQAQNEILSRLKQ